MSDALAVHGSRERPRFERTFVGRRRELGELLAGLDSAIAGRGRLFLLVGEPGIGKSSLADELATHAHGAGARVLWGRCWDGGVAPSYWPWKQILRALAGERPIAEAARALGGGVRHLAQMFPEAFPDAFPDPGQPPEAARFELFDAVATLLKDVARGQPLVLVLDDLHAADEPSLLLLQFLARDLRGTQMLLIGTYRDLEARAVPPVAALLGALAREGMHLRLQGFNEAEVATFIAAATGHTASDALIHAVHDATGGNAFFVEELVRLLEDEGKLDAGSAAALDVRVPDGIRAAIRRRLEPLDPEVVDILATAAVIGREFDIPTLEGVSDRDGRVLLEALGHAVRLGVVTEITTRPGQFAFTHALIRETLYEDLPPAARVELHGSVASVLEKLQSAPTGPHVAVLAHHYFLAAPHNADKAIAYALEAGRRATRMLAYEQAVVQCVRALHAADLAGIGGERRCELLLELAGAQGRAGDVVSARETYDLAAEMARALASPVLLAHAALGSGSVVATPTGGMVDDELVDLLEDALAGLDEGHARLRAQLLARLAMELYYVSPRERRDAFSAEALAIARSIDDAGVVGYALNARRFALRGPGGEGDDAAVANEILRLAEDAGDVDLTLEAHAWSVVAALEAGDLGTADEAIDAHRRTAERVRHARGRWEAKVFEAMRALLTGDLERADSASKDALELGRAQKDGPLMRSVASDALIAHAVQQFYLARVRGELAQTQRRVQAFAEQYPQVAAWRTALASLYADLGRVDDARREFERLASADFGEIAQDGNWLTAMANLAETCAALGNVECARTLYARLAPYDGRVIVIARAAAVRGAVAHFLALLAATIGERDDAGRHFASALATYTRMGARALTAAAQLAYGRMLAEGDDAERDEGRGCIQEALELAEGIGARAVAQAARAALGDAHPRTAGARARVGVSVGEPQVPRFQREGEYWTVGLGARDVRLKDAKGMRYLAALLARPHEELHVLELVGASRTGPAAAPLEVPSDLTSDATGDSGVVLDGTAKAAYRRRLEELRAELDEAQRFHDPVRAERAEEEIAFLARELAHGVGLGGRDRKLGSPAERARVSVTKAIKNAIRRIGENDAELGRYLERHVRTGTFCCYAPTALTGDGAAAQPDR